MSHEIRTPMTAILGYTDLLKETLIDEASRNAIETIGRNGNHLLSIINDILDLSKIEAGKMTIESIRFSLRQVLADVESLMQVRTQGKGIKLRIEQDGLLPETILTDPTRLRQILVNLVGNAVKFTETGSVNLVVRLVRQQPPMLEWDVIDTGIGLTQEQQQALFQPFMQADNSTVRKFGGTGLGLTISKRLAELLGGDVRIVQSQVGVGTTFRLTIAAGPLEGVRLLQPNDSFAAQEEPLRDQAVVLNLPEGCRILLAEDGPDNQRLISFVLKKAGAVVTVAENGQQAVDLVAAAGDAAVRRDPDGHANADHGWLHRDDIAAPQRLHAADHRTYGSCDVGRPRKVPRRRLRRLRHEADRPVAIDPASRPADSGRGVAIKNRAPCSSSSLRVSLVGNSCIARSAGIMRAPTRRSLARK